MLKVGIAKVDITPELGIRLAGYGIPDRPAEVVHDALAVTALVLEEGAEKAAHITLDVCQVAEDDLLPMRQAASKCSGIPEENINIGVSHTHSAPQTFTIDGWGDKEVAYLQMVSDRIVQAVEQAWNAREAVRVGIGVTQTKVGVNRRAVGLNSVPFFGASVGGPYDPTMTVIRFEGASRTVGTLVHCTAHPTAMGCNRLVSRDWPGVMVDRVESQTGAPVLFINGTYGDVGPRTSFRAPDVKAFSAGTGDGVHAVNEVGYRAAADALWTWDAIRHFETDVPLRVISEPIGLPLANLPPLEEALKNRAEYESFKSAWGGERCRYAYWDRVVKAHEHPQKTEMPFQQTIIAIGSVALIPMPGEAFTSIATRLKHFSPYQHTLVCGGTNGMLTYLPDREARARGGYEVVITIGVLTQLLAENSDDALVNENLRLLENLHQKN